MKSKIAFMVCTVLCFLSVPVFALDVTTDVLLGGFYNYSNVFTGKSKYQTVNGYDNVTVDGDYNAIFRAGLMGVSGVERTAGGVTDKIDNTEIGYNVFLDVGGVYAFNFGNFSLNLAPALSMLFVNSDNREHLFSRATTDSLLGFGMTADVYAKYRYKYFVCSAGCAASFYPLSLVSSSDTKIQYSTNIRDTMAYNLRPYISVGFSIRERTSSTISAGGEL